MTIDHCTVRSNGQYGICIDGPPSSISDCRITNNYLDGVWLDWPNKTRLKGSGARRNPIAALLFFTGQVFCLLLSSEQRRDWLTQDLRKILGQVTGLFFPGVTRGGCHHLGRLCWHFQGISQYTFQCIFQCVSKYVLQYTLRCIYFECVFQYIFQFALQHNFKFILQYIFKFLL